jgi:hypothetical protein
MAHAARWWRRHPDVAQDERVAAETRPILLLRHGLSGEGYLVCDACAFLAHLPADVTLN